MKKRTIAVFTGNRAEYGLQYPILRAIDRHPNLDYKLLVSGAHLDTSFGQTIAEIQKDGFHIDAEAKIEMDASSLFSTAQAIGSGVLAISKILAEMNPDIMIAYGDRFEAFAAVIASSQMRIPTAHVEGGDLTEGGALDDTVRHAMTKLAHIHFSTNAQATNRILAMGEEPWRVHTVGFSAIDLIAEGRYSLREEVQDALKLDLTRPIIVVTQHSVATEYDSAVAQFEPTLNALERLSTEGVQVVITYPNNDAGGRQLIERILAFQERNLPNVIVRRSLGRHLYHGLLALAKGSEDRVACIGNSSSGIKETPAFGCPTVNIGARQDRRLRGENVVDASYDSKAIYEAVHRCLFDEAFRSLCREAKNPYWLGDAGPKIADVLASVELGPRLIRKRMLLEGETRDGWFR